MPSDSASFVGLLRSRERAQANERAYVFLTEPGVEEASMTYAELCRRAQSLAYDLYQRCRPGDRALLVFAPGLDFLVAFFGCLVAGVIGVPMMVPRRQIGRDSSAAIVMDCAPRLALTNAATLDSRADLADRFKSWPLDWLQVDGIFGSHGQSSRLATPKPEDIAFLQYTSGSTSEPKGVAVTHGNMIANSEMIRASHGNTARSTYVSWVPHYHDMGLMLNLLQSFYVGALGVLMNPVSFMKRPLTWLRTISDYRAEVAGGPNFAFDLCVDRFTLGTLANVNLSCWKVALNGAEPVMARTMERFSSTFLPCGFDPRAFFPAYGLAEATVLVSAGKRGAGPISRSVSRSSLQQGVANPVDRGGDSRVLVGCGKSLPGEGIAIVEPSTRRRLAANRIGEVWIRGPNVANGYWGKEDESEHIFRAQIFAEEGRCWLRSGDLGFLDDDGELFVSGRIKDTIVIRGINHYPQDIEITVQDSHGALRRHHGAAFAALDDKNVEGLVIVQEVDRAGRHRVSIDELEGIIREAVVLEHGINPRSVVLVLPGQIPMTTSGKVQRSRARQLWKQAMLRLV